MSGEKEELNNVNDIEIKEEEHKVNVGGETTICGQLTPYDKEKDEDEEHGEGSAESLALAQGTNHHSDAKKEMLRFIEENINRLYNQVKECKLTELYLENAEEAARSEARKAEQAQRCLVFLDGFEESAEFEQFFRSVLCGERPPMVSPAYPFHPIIPEPVPSTSASLFYDQDCD